MAGKSLWSHALSAYVSSIMLVSASFAVVAQGTARSGTPLLNAFLLYVVDIGSPFAFFTSFP